MSDSCCKHHFAYSQALIDPLEPLPLISCAPVRESSEHSSQVTVQPTVTIIHTQHRVLARVLLFHYSILVDSFYSSLDHAVGT